MALSLVLSCSAQERPKQAVHSRPTRLLALWLSSQIFQDSLQVNVQPAPLILRPGPVGSSHSWPRTPQSGFLLTVNRGTATLSVVP